MLGTIVWSVPLDDTTMERGLLFVVRTIPSATRVQGHGPPTCDEEHPCQCLDYGQFQGSNQPPTTTTVTRRYSWHDQRCIPSPKKIGQDIQKKDLRAKPGTPSIRSAKRNSEW